MLGASCGAIASLRPASRRLPRLQTATRPAESHKPMRARTRRRMPGQTTDFALPAHKEPSWRTQQSRRRSSGVPCAQFSCAQMTQRSMTTQCRGQVLLDLTSLGGLWQGTDSAKAVKKGRYRKRRARKPRTKGVKPDNPAQSKRFSEAAKAMGADASGKPFAELTRRLLKPKGKSGTNV